MYFSNNKFSIFDGLIFVSPTFPIPQLLLISTGVFTIDIHDTLSDVADRFMQSRFRRFSVTKGGKLAGQISRRDVLRAVDQLSKEDYSS